MPNAIQVWAYRTASTNGGTPEVTFWLIKRKKYDGLIKADFTIVPAVQYSLLVQGFRDHKIETIGKQVAFGEIAKQQGQTWVRNFSKPLQYKFENMSSVKDLRFSGGFSLGPMN